MRFLVLLAAIANDLESSSDPAMAQAIKEVDTTRSESLDCAQAIATQLP